MSNQSIIKFFHEKIEMFPFSVVQHLIKDCIILCTVKPVLSDHSEIDKTEIFMTNGGLMKVESIAECSHWGILQYF